MTLNEIVNFLNGIAWGPWMLILLVGTGIYLSVRVGFIQFAKFGYVMKNTLGKLFKKQSAGDGEVTPFQALATALAATVGTGNIAGVTGAIAVGGPMYYIRNGLGKKWNWLAVLFSLLGALAAFGIGNMTQVNTIAGSINNAIDAFGGNTAANSFEVFGQMVPFSSVIIGGIVAFIVALTLFGGVKRIGTVTERLVPVMALIYILCALCVVFTNLGSVGKVFAMIFQGAFNAEAALGGAFGITIMTTIQKGVGRGVFSNEAGLGSAPIAHAATSEMVPVKQGMYGIFEVFMDTIGICPLTALTLLCGVEAGVDITWGQSAGAELIAASFATVFGDKIGALIVAMGIGLFALTTILSWSLYGTRCFEFLFKGKGVGVFQTIFVAVIVIGATLKLDLVWNIADTLNGFMAIPNLVALLGLSGVVIKLTKEYFQK